jgi:hypothetical protein
MIVHGETCYLDSGSLKISTTCSNKRSLSNESMLCCVVEMKGSCVVVRIGRTLLPPVMPIDHIKIAKRTLAVEGCRDTDDGTEKSKKHRSENLIDAERVFAESTKIKFDSRCECDMCHQFTVNAMRCCNGGICPTCLGGNEFCPFCARMLVSK